MDKTINSVESEELTIHEYFPDWIRPTELGKDRESVKHRWTTVQRLAIDEQSISKDNIEDLILLASDCASKDSTFDYLRSEIKKDDYMFSTSEGSNEEELKVLASCILSLLTDEMYYDNQSISELTTRILCSSFTGKRIFKGGRSLLKHLQNSNFSTCRAMRERTNLTAPILNFKYDDENIKAIDAYKANPHPTLIQAAFKALNDEMDSQRANANSRMNGFVTLLNKKNNIVNEEQEILWWMNVGWSDILDKPYSEISSDRLILISSLDLAKKTKLRAELPSTKALFSRIGLDNETIQFKKWINSITNTISKQEKEIIQNSTLLTPVLYALKLSEDGSWIRKWEKETNLISSNSVSTLELAQQIYREALIIQWC